MEPFKQVLRATTDIMIRETSRYYETSRYNETQAYIKRQTYISIRQRKELLREIQIQSDRWTSIER